LKARILPDDTIELDGNPSEIAIVIKESFTKAVIKGPDPDFLHKMASNIAAAAAEEIEKEIIEDGRKAKNKKKSYPGAWTPAEDKILLAEKAKHTPDIEIGKKLKRSPGAVSVRASVLKKAVDKSGKSSGKKSKAGKWSPDEDRRLKAEFPHHSEAEICSILKRPAKEVHARIIELKNAGELQ
jgi:hypothetical protein